MIDLDSVVLGLGSGLLVFFVGYFKGYNDGLGLGLERLREIREDLGNISSVMEESIERTKRNVP